MLLDDAGTARKRRHCRIDPDSVVAEAGIPREVDLAELESGQRRRVFRHAIEEIDPAGGADLWKALTAPHAERHDEALAGCGAGFDQPPILDRARRDLVAAHADLGEPSHALDVEDRRHEFDPDT